MDILKTLGLSEPESNVYFAILGGGKMTAAGIAKTAGLKRTTIYPYIETLLRSGLIRQIILGKRHYYVAESPLKLRAKFDQQRKTLDEQLPNLLDLYKSGAHEPSVSSFFGIDGVETVKDDIKKNALYLKTIFSPAQYYTTFTPHETRAFAQALAKREVMLESLYPDDAASRELYNIEREFGFKTKFLPKDYRSAVNILIYNKKVALISYENLFGVVIDNVYIADAHEQMFDHIWKTIEK